MISSRTPSPIDKLAVAVVHQPERAIPAPVGAREESLRLLLQTAADSGVTRVATRPDGDGERWLGQAWPFPSPFQVSVCTVSVNDGVDRVEARARRSLERLGLPRGDLLLVSSASDLAGAEGRALWDRLLALKDRGLYRRIGFCATIEDGPALLARRFQPDVVQLGCNLLDQRAIPLTGERLPVEVVGRGHRALVGAGAAAMLMHDDAADGLHALGQPEVVGRGEDEFAGLVRGRIADGVFGAVGQAGQGQEEQGEERSHGVVTSTARNRFGSRQRWLVGRVVAIRVGLCPTPDPWPSS